jgi:hypothetical protein
LKTITEFLASKDETFTIDPFKDTIITCQKGTKVFLKSNSLQHKDGSVPTGEVEVKIREFYSLSEFTGNNLTTTSGDKLLETGGMVNISVSSNGEPLILQDGKEYALYFPKKKHKEDMQLFYGDFDENRQIDWKLSSDKEPEIKQTRKTNTTNSEPGSLNQTQDSCVVSLLRNRWSFYDRDVKWKLKNSEQTVYDYFDKNFVAPDSMREQCCSIKNPLELRIKLDSVGKINFIKIYRHHPKSPSIPKEYYPLISNFFYDMPPFDLESMAKSYPYKSYTLILGGKLTGKRYNREFKEKYASFKDKAVTKIDKSELSYYVQTATKFGWINCDRFINNQNDNINFAVNTNSTNDTKVIIAFKDLNSVMQGYQQGNSVIFNRIPTNMPVKVIGISIANGKPAMAIAETTTNRMGFQLSGFKEFTLAELEKELNSLN